MYIHIHIYEYVYIYEKNYIQIYVYTYIYVHIYIDECIKTFIHIYIYIYIYVYICINMHNSSGKGKILIATDVASRGLDVKDIDIVINYDFPVGSVAIESYVHRIGRTARGDRTGTAYTFFTQKSVSHGIKMCELLERSEQPIPSALRQMLGGYVENIHENGIENMHEIRSDKRHENNDENGRENGFENRHENEHENNHENSYEKVDLKLLKNSHENTCKSSSSIIDDENDKLISKSLIDDNDEFKMISPRGFNSMYTYDHMTKFSQKAMRDSEKREKKILKKSSIHGVFLNERVSKKV
jgi:superfamily II DNA/RNA helicase